MVGNSEHVSLLPLGLLMNQKLICSVKHETLKGEDEPESFSLNRMMPSNISAFSELAQKVEKFLRFTSLDSSMPFHVSLQDVITLKV